MNTKPAPHKTVLITGSSSGIGRASLLAFERRGWNIVAAARKPEALHGWRDGATRLRVRLDVTDSASIEQAIAATLDRFGGIDALVNNAGYGLYGPLEAMSSDELEAQFRTNVFGVAETIRQVLPGMRQRRSGVIVNVSSIGGRVTAPFMSAYCATKFALEGLSESLFYELSQFGIRVKILEPGHFKTGFLSSIQLAKHPAYQTILDNHMSWVLKDAERAPGPEAAAQAIYKAVCDPSSRLRYPVRGEPMLTLSQLLPWAMWSSFAGMSMSRAR